MCIAHNSNRLFHLGLIRSAFIRVLVLNLFFASFSLLGGVAMASEDVAFGAFDLKNGVRAISSYSSLTLEQSFDEEKFSGTLEFEFREISDNGELYFRSVKNDFTFRERPVFTAEQLVRGEQQHFLEKFSFDLKPYSEIKLSDLPAQGDAPYSIDGKVKLYVNIAGENRRFVDEVRVTIRKIANDPHVLEGEMLFGKNPNAMVNGVHPLNYQMNGTRPQLSGKVSFSVKAQ